MRVIWYGHAAFGVEGKNAAGKPVKIIVDPYNYPDCGGYLPIAETADVVSVSHENQRYHSDTSSIEGEFELLEALEITGGSREVAGVQIHAFEVFESTDLEGPNAMVKFTLEDITVAHQGDLGHPLEEAALNFLRDVDVLLALAGGPPTIDLADLVEVIEETSPALVLPMHYKTPKVNLDLMTVDHFLRLCGGFEIEWPPASLVELSKETLPPPTKVLVLEHAR